MQYLPPKSFVDAFNFRSMDAVHFFIFSSFFFDIDCTLVYFEMAVDNPAAFLI